MAEFEALVLHETAEKPEVRFERLPEESLPPGDVTVRVTHSTLNYKDGMILNGLGRLVRSYPHVPGVDFAGIVEASDHPDHAPGDAVVLTGWRVGENRWGGYAERARVQGDWLVPVPPGLDPARAMAIGTAGLTAMLAVMTLERHGLTNEAEGPVLVTGAAGGLGGIAVMLLARLGYSVAALTGRPETEDYLRRLGAAEIVPRAELAEPTKRPLETERWAGAVDAVGGPVLARLLGQLRYRASVAACGNAGGVELPANVLPFLLRGVNLLGIDSVLCPLAERREAWRRLALSLPLDSLDAMTTKVGLRELPALADSILAGGVQGRVVVEIAPGVGGGAGA